MLQFVQNKLFDRQAILLALNVSNLHFDEEILSKVESTIHAANKIAAHIRVQMGLFDTYSYPVRKSDFLADIQKRINELQNKHEEVLLAYIDDADMEYLSANQESQTCLKNLQKSLTDEKDLHELNIVYGVLEFLEISESEKGYSKRLMDAYEKISVLLSQY